MNKGIILLLDDLREDWVPVLRRAGIQTVGLHVNPYTHKGLYTYTKIEEHRKTIEAFAAVGIAVEYALHIVSDMVKRTLFEQDPALFRVDTRGQRNPDYNICASNPAALRLLSDTTYDFVRFLQQKSHRYHLWTDDAADYPLGAICHCDKCKHISGADQNVLLSRAILEGIRRYDPQAKLSYLVYGDTDAPPTLPVSPNDFFMEFAPYHREHLRPLGEGEINASYRRLLQQMYDVFPREETEILEYWLSRSYFDELAAGESGQAARIAEEIRWYVGTGAGYISTFSQPRLTGASGGDAEAIVRYGAMFATAGGKQ